MTLRTCVHIAFAVVCLLSPTWTKAAPPADRSSGGNGPADISFPVDHGNHPLSLSEWWYFNGHLFAGGREYGYELTFFRGTRAIYFIHAALTDVQAQKHPFVRRYMKLGEASCREKNLDVTYGSSWARVDQNGKVNVAFDVPGNRVNLTLESHRAPMMVNGNGVIKMPEGGTSKYYSFTRMRTTGTIETAGGAQSTVTGLSWFDHQWGNFVVLLRPWDWFAFQMEDGTDYNLFSFRAVLGYQTRACANALKPDGSLQVSNRMQLARTAWWKSPRTGDNFVTAWKVTIPDRNEVFDVTTPAPDQEMHRVGLTDLPPPYWEGTVNVIRHNADGSVTRGVGYSEHMPYKKQEDPKEPWYSQRNAPEAELPESKQVPNGQATAGSGYPFPVGRRSQPQGGALAHADESSSAGLEKTMIVRPRGPGLLCPVRRKPILFQNRSAPGFVSKTPSWNSRFHSSRVAQ